MGAYVLSRFVDHPKFGDRLLDLKPNRGECFQISLHWHQHVFEDSLAIDPNEA
jgi:hypothetical protein